MQRLTPTKVINLAHIKAAAKRIAPYISKTPTMTSPYFDNKVGKEVVFKCEIFQTTGAFKYRGTTNVALTLNEEESNEKPKLVTHSSGNHAHALALAAKIHGLEAHIVMPSDAPEIKKSAVRTHGATLYECFASQEAREAMTLDLIDKLGPRTLYISACEHPGIIAGAGTMALEILEAHSDVDAFVVPVSGGGMLSGTCIAAKGINPNIKVFAAEPLLADDCARSFAAKERLRNIMYPKTIADGLRSNVAEGTWPIIRDNISDVITVTEEEIIEATRLVFDRMKLVIEPSAGVGVAALMTEQFQKSYSDIKKVALILCGGNIDLYKLPWLK